MPDITKEDQKALRKLNKLVGDLNIALRELHEQGYRIKVTTRATKPGHENLVFGMKRVLK